MSAILKQNANGITNTIEPNGCGVFIKNKNKYKVSGPCGNLRPLFAAQFPQSAIVSVSYKDNYVNKVK